MNKLSIAFITNNYTPYRGGVVHAIDAIASELQRRGHSIRIFAPDFLGTHNNDPFWVTRLHCPIKFVYRSKYLAIPWRSRLQLQEKLHVMQPDIIHAHHPFLLGPAALSVAHRLSIPTIFTYHTMYEHYAYHVPLPSSLSQSIILQRVHAFCKKVDCIIAPSAAIAQQLQQQNITTPLAIIPSPIRACFFDNKIKTVEVKSSGTFRVLFVSRFVPEKNVSFILEAIVLLKDQSDIFFDLVGYGPEFEYAQHYIRENAGHASDRVCFVHKPDLEQLLAYYHKAQVFLFSSKTDTQGLVLAEAMACGTPVICTRGPGQSDIISEGHNGLFVDTPEEMAHAIIKLKENSLLLVSMQQAALCTAQRYQPHVVTNQIEELYRCMLMRKRAMQKSEGPEFNR